MEKKILASDLIPTPGAKNEIMDNKVLHQLTELEKAALLLRHYNNEKTFKMAFLLSHPEQDINSKSLDSSVSRWKRSDQVQNFITEIESKDQARIKAQILNLQRRKENTTPGNQDPEREKGKETISASWHNFTDLNEFLGFCEMQANLLTDEKDRKDYLKIIADLMQYKNQDKGNGEIQRFYVPLLCSQCPLYNKEK